MSNINKYIEERPCIAFNKGKPLFVKRNYKLSYEKGFFFYETERRSFLNLHKMWFDVVGSQAQMDIEPPFDCPFCKNSSKKENPLGFSYTYADAWNPDNRGLEYQLVIFPKPRYSEGVLTQHPISPYELYREELIDVAKCQSDAMKMILNHFLENNSSNERSLAVLFGMNRVIGQTRDHIHYRVDGVSFPREWKRHELPTLPNQEIITYKDIKITLAYPLDIVLTINKPLWSLSEESELLSQIIDTKLSIYLFLNRVLDQPITWRSERNALYNYRYPYTEVMEQTAKSENTSYRIRIFDFPGVTEMCYFFEESVSIENTLKNSLLDFFKRT